MKSETEKILRNAVDGSIFDTPDGFAFEYFKTFVEVASGISPKFFRNFVQSFDKRSP